MVISVFIILRKCVQNLGVLYNRGTARGLLLFRFRGLNNMILEAHIGKTENNPNPTTKNDIMQILPFKNMILLSAISFEKISRYQKSGKMKNIGKMGAHRADIRPSGLQPNF